MSLQDAIENSVRNTLQGTFGPGADPVLAALTAEDPIAWLRAGHHLEGSGQVDAWRDYGVGGRRGCWLNGTDSVMRVDGAAAASKPELGKTWEWRATLVTNRPSSDVSLITLCDGGASFKYFSLRLTSLGRFGLFSLYDGAVSLNSSGGTHFYSTVKLARVSIAFDGVDEWVVTVDGSVLATLTAAPSGFNDYDQLSIGARWTGSYDDWYEGMIRDVAIYKDGELVASIPGHGPTAEDFVDQVGGSAATRVGTPSSAVQDRDQSGFTEGWRKGADALAEVAPSIGADPMSRPCPQSDGTKRMLASFAEELSADYAIFLVAKTDVASGDHTLIDGPDVDHRGTVHLDTSGVWKTNMGGTARTSAASPTTGWHTFYLRNNGSSDELYVDGVQVISGDAGADALTGLNLFMDYADANGWDGTLADLLVVESPSSDFLSNCLAYARQSYGLNAIPYDFFDDFERPDTAADTVTNAPTGQVYDLRTGGAPRDNPDTQIVGGSLICAAGNTYYAGGNFLGGACTEIGSELEWYADPGTAKVSQLLYLVKPDNAFLDELLHCSFRRDRVTIQLTPGPFPAQPFETLALVDLGETDWDGEGGGDLAIGVRYKLVMRVAGDTITMLINGIEICTATDSRITSQPINGSYTYWEHYDGGNSSNDNFYLHKIWATS